MRAMQAWTPPQAREQAPLPLRDAHSSPTHTTTATELGPGLVTRGGRRRHVPEQPGTPKHFSAVPTWFWRLQPVHRGAPGASSHPELSMATAGREAVGQVGNRGAPEDHAISTQTVHWRDGWGPVAIRDPRIARPRCLQVWARNGGGRGKAGEEAGATHPSTSGGGSAAGPLDRPGLMNQMVPKAGPAGNVNRSQGVSMGGRGRVPCCSWGPPRLNSSHGTNSGQNRLSL